MVPQSGGAPAGRRAGRGRAMLAADLDAVAGGISLRASIRELLRIRPGATGGAGAGCLTRRPRRSPEAMACGAGGMPGR